MSLADIQIAIRVTDNFTAAVKRAQQSVERWFWATWWAQWGTDGWKRRTALVVRDDDREVARLLEEAIG